MLIPFYNTFLVFCYMYYCLPILMPPNIMQWVKTLRTLFSHIEFILVKKNYIITNSVVLNLTIPKKKLQF